MIEKIFDEYTSNYDMSDEGIRLKWEHSYRVQKLSVKYAKEIGFEERDVFLASIIGLFHDIGRFEQWKNFQTFDDVKTIDHADYGVDVLFVDGLINSFPINDEEKEIVRFAIKNHNKFAIEETDDNRKLMHAKLIRDTDKIDIFKIHAENAFIKIKETEEEVSPKVIESVINHVQVNKVDVQNVNDQIVVLLCFAFDINYDECLEEMKNNIKEYFKKVNRKHIYQDAYDEIIRYIESREENARN